MIFTVEVKKMNILMRWFRRTNFKPQKATRINGLWYVTFKA